MDRRRRCRRWSNRQCRGLARRRILERQTARTFVNITAAAVRADTRRMLFRRFAPLTLVSCAGLAALVAAACTGLTSPSVSFSGSDAQTLASQFATSAVNGANAGNRASTQSRGRTGRLEAPRPLGSVLTGLFNPRSVSCNASGTTCQLFEQYSQTTTCNTGGRESVSGLMSGSVSSGSLGAFGTINLQQTDSIVDWTCDGGWTVNGDPYISDTGTMTMTGNHYSFSFHEGGGWVASATTNGSRVSCQENVTVSWDNTALGGHFSGTVTCSPGGSFSVSGSF